MAARAARSRHGRPALQVARGGVALDQLVGGIGLHVRVAVDVSVWPTDLDVGARGIAVARAEAEVEAGVAAREEAAAAEPPCRPGTAGAGDADEGADAVAVRGGPPEAQR